MRFFKKSAYIFYISLFFCVCAQAKIDYANIDWNKLNLSAQQNSKIKQLDKDWQLFSSTIRGKLYQDQQTLQCMLCYPNTSDNEIRLLQWKIVTKQQQLRDEALENFLKKRKLLNSSQLKELHKMLTTTD